MPNSVQHVSDPSGRGPRSHEPGKQYSATSSLVGIPEVLQFQICLALDIPELATLALCCSNLRKAALHNQVWLVIYWRRFGRKLARPLRNTHSRALLHSYLRKVYSQVLRAACKGVELRGAKKRSKAHGVSCAVDQVAVVDGNGVSDSVMDQVIAGFRDGMVECYSLVGGKRTAQAYANELLLAQRLTAERENERGELAASHKNTLLRFKLQQSRGGPVAGGNRSERQPHRRRPERQEHDDDDDETSTADSSDHSSSGVVGNEDESESCGDEAELFDIDHQFDLWSAGMLDDEPFNASTTKPDANRSVTRAVQTKKKNNNNNKSLGTAAQPIPTPNQASTRRQTSYAGADAADAQVSVSPIVTNSLLQGGGDAHVDSGHLSDGSGRSRPDAMLWVRKPSRRTKASKKQKKKLRQAQHKVQERPSATLVPADRSSAVRDPSCSAVAPSTLQLANGPLGLASPPVPAKEGVVSRSATSLARSIDQSLAEQSKAGKYGKLGRRARRRLQREMYDEAVARAMTPADKDSPSSSFPGELQQTSARLDRSASTSSLLSYDWVSSSSDSECTGGPSSNSNIGGDYVDVGAEVSRGLNSSTSSVISSSGSSSAASASSMRHANKRGRHVNSDVRRGVTGGRNRHTQSHAKAHKRACGDTQFVLTKMRTKVGTGRRTAGAGCTTVAGLAIFADDSLGLLTSSVKGRADDGDDECEGDGWQDETHLAIGKELLPPSWLTKTIGPVTCAITIPQLCESTSNNGQNASNTSSPTRSRKRAVAAAATAVVTGHADGVVVFWDVSSNFVARMDVVEGKHLGASTAVVCLASADSRVLATADADGNVVTWDLNEKRKLSTMRQRRATLDANSAMDDLRRVGGSNSNTPRKSVRGTIPRQSPGATEGHLSTMVRTLAVTQTVVIAGRSDGSVTVWLRSGQTLMHRVEAHAGELDGVDSSGGVICCSVPTVFPVFGPAAQGADVVFGTGGDDALASLWVLDTRMRANVIGGNTRPPSGLRKHAPGIGGVGRRLGSAAHDDVLHEPVQVVLRKHVGAVRQIVVDPHKVVTGGDDGTIRIWNVNDELEGQLVRTLRWRGGRSAVVALAVDVGVIVGGALDGSLQAFVFGNWEDRRRQAIAADTLQEQLQRRQRLLLKAQSEAANEVNAALAAASPRRRRTGRVGRGENVGGNTLVMTPVRHGRVGESGQRLPASGATGKNNSNSKSSSTGSSARVNANASVESNVNASKWKDRNLSKTPQQRQNRRVSLRGEGRSKRHTKRNGGGSGSGKGGVAWCNASKNTIRDLMDDKDDEDVDWYVARELGLRGGGGGSLFQ